jgi:hypothetical protein
LNPALAPVIAASKLPSIDAGTKKVSKAIGRMAAMLSLRNSAVRSQTVPIFTMAILFLPRRFVRVSRAPERCQCLRKRPSRRNRRG